MKYSKQFERDYAWYIEVSHKFNFDGKVSYRNKKGINIIQPDKNGKDAKYCFYLFDCQGKIVKTKEPEKLECLLKTKGSVNLHIKMYAEDRARGYLPKIEFDKIAKEFIFPNWVINAVEQQKSKYYI